MREENTPDQGEPQTASIVAPDQWLVRTRQNKILGPMSRAEVCRLINERVIGLEDEVCRAGFYWFYLHEHKELSAQLGIHLPTRIRDEDEEVTETETDVLKLAERVEGSAHGADGTMVFSSSFRDQSPTASNASPSNSQDTTIDAEEQFRRQLTQGIERDSFRKTFVGFIFVVFVGLLIWLFRLLRSS